MRRRLYFVLPDVASAEKTLDDLLLARVEVGHIRFLGRRGTPLGTLPAASYLQKSDIVHGTQIGLVVGGLAGLLMGAAIGATPLGSAFPQQLLIALSLGGAVFGAWAAGLVAASTPNSRLKPFAADLDAGCILMMVDVPGQRMAEIIALVGRRHPEAVPRGMEPTIPAFP